MWILDIGEKVDGGFESRQSQDNPKNPGSGSVTGSVAKRIEIELEIGNSGENLERHLFMKTTPPPPCPFERLHPSELNRDAAYYMSHAYNESLKAWAANEVPIGAVIEYNGEIVARAYNQVESLNDPTAHAEILAITQATEVVGDWRLNGATLYVTKEPCPMCSGASVMARLSRVVYAVADPKMGCLGGAYPVHELPQLNHRVEVTGGVLEEECKAVLQGYFQRKRGDG